MNELTGPDALCTVDGCQEPAVVTPRAPTTDEVSDAPAGELVPLCAEHAEQADVPPVPGPT
jgi:hypothetical protein